MYVHVHHDRSLLLLDLDSQGQMPCLLGVQRCQTGGGLHSPVQRPQGCMHAPDTTMLTSCMVGMRTIARATRRASGKEDTSSLLGVSSQAGRLAGCVPMCYNEHCRFFRVCRHTGVPPIPRVL